MPGGELPGSEPLHEVSRHREKPGHGDPGPGHRARLVAACHNAAMGFDLVIRGATVVTPGHREAADVGIADGRIAQLGGTMTGAEELAAGGLLAIPGGVDAHTHLAHRGLGDRVGFPIWVDDFGPARGPRSPAASPRSAT